MALDQVRQKVGQGPTFGVEMVCCSDPKPWSLAHKNLFPPQSYYTQSKVFNTQSRLLGARVPQENIQKVIAGASGNLEISHHSTLKLTLEAEALFPYP